MISDPPRMLDELCVQLGLCLDPAARAHIAIAQFRDVDAVEAAVLKAEGIDPLDAPRQLRHDLRECISRYFE